MLKQQWPGVLEKIITRRVPFGEFQAAYDRQAGDIKVVIEASRG